MGRFSSLVVLLLAACGDNSGSVTGPGHNPQDDVGPSSADGTSPRYLPSVCGVQSWSTSTADRIVDLSVAGSSSGATVLGVPEAGGVIKGFVLDTRMRMMAGEQKVDVQIPLTQISAADLGHRVAATGIANGTAYLNILDNDLSNPQFIVKMPANALSKPAFWNTQADIVMPVGDDTGMRLYRFQDSGEPIDSISLAKTKPARAMTSAQVGVSLMTAWSTDYECYVTQNAAFAPGPVSMMHTACPSPSMVFNKRSGLEAMVFESPEGVRLMNLEGIKMGDSQLLRPDSSSPRALFDGTNTWVSYLDARGDVIVGFLDADNHVVSMSLNGPKPSQNAYQLAMIENAPWVIALDDSGYTGHRLCVDAQW